MFAKLFFDLIWIYFHILNPEKIETVQIEAISLICDMLVLIKNNMKLTLNKKNRGINIAWFFMVITTGAFLNDLKDALQTIEGGNLGFEGAFKTGYSMGGRLGLVFLLGIGMLLYTRTKKRKFNHTVWGSKIIDYILVFILIINFIFPLLSGRGVNGTGNDIMAFFYVTASLLAYAYASLAKPKTSLPENPKRNLL